MTAGVAHELNNPAAAVQRAAGQLADQVDRLVSATGAARRPRAPLLDDRGSAPARSLDALAASDEELRVEDWLDSRGVTDAGQLAPDLVAAGVGVDDLAGLGEDVADAVRLLSAAALPAPAGPGGGHRVGPALRDRRRPAVVHLPRPRAAAGGGRRPWPRGHARAPARPGHGWRAGRPRARAGPAGHHGDGGGAQPGLDQPRAERLPRDSPGPPTPPHAAGVRGRGRRGRRGGGRRARDPGRSSRSGSSTRSSRPRRRARAPGSGCRSATGSWSSSTGRADGPLRAGTDHVPGVAAAVPTVSAPDGENFGT